MQTAQGPQGKYSFLQGASDSTFKSPFFLPQVRSLREQFIRFFILNISRPFVMQLRRRLPLDLLPSTSCFSYFSFAVIKHDQNSSGTKMFNWARGFGELESMMAEPRHGGELRTHSLTYKEKAERAPGTTPSDSRPNLPIPFKLFYPPETKHSNMNRWEAILIQTTMLPKPHNFTRVQLDGTGPGGQPVPGPLPH